MFSYYVIIIYYYLLYYLIMLFLTYYYVSMNPIKDSSLHDFSSTIVDGGGSKYVQN